MYGHLQMLETEDVLSVGCFLLPTTVSEGRVHWMILSGSSFLLFQASIGKYHLVTLMIVQKHVVMTQFCLRSFLLDTDKIMDICGDVIRDEAWVSGKGPVVHMGSSLFFPFNTYIYIYKYIDRYSNDICKVTGKYCTASLPLFGGMQHIQYRKMKFASCKSSTFLTIAKHPRQFDGGHGWSVSDQRFSNKFQVESWNCFAHQAWPTDGEAIWGFPKMVGLPNNYWFSY